MNFKVILCLFKVIYLYIHVIANLHMTTACFMKYIYKRKTKQGTLTKLLHSLSFILEHIKFYVSRERASYNVQR